MIFPYRCSLKRIRIDTRRATGNGQGPLGRKVDSDFGPAGVQSPTGGAIGPRWPRSVYRGFGLAQKRWRQENPHFGKWSARRAARSRRNSPRTSGYAPANWDRLVQESKVKGLFRIVRDFDAIYTRHSGNGHKSEQDFALCIGPNRGKGPVYWPAFSASLLYDIEALSRATPLQ